MQNQRIKFILTSLILLVFSSNSALAEENIYFHPAKSAKELYIIDKVAKKLELSGEHMLAKTDLNNDSIDEFFMRPATCQNQQRCPITIIALQKDAPIIIGQLEAVRVIISDDNTYGIRDLLVAETRINDFKQTKYQWNPHSYTYKNTDK